MSVVCVSVEENTKDIVKKAARAVGSLSDTGTHTSYDQYKGTRTSHDHYKGTHTS